MSCCVCLWCDSKCLWLEFLHGSSVWGGIWVPAADDSRCDCSWSCGCRPGRCTKGNNIRWASVLIPRVTCGDLADHIMGEKAGKSCHNLGVVSVYVIRCDDFFHHRHLEYLHDEQGWGSAFPHGHTWQCLQSIISLFPGGTRVLTVVFQKVGDVMYTQTGRLVVA